MDVTAVTAANTMTAAARPNMSTNLPSDSPRADRMVNSLL
jgi:hypothetical protein